MQVERRSSKASEFRAIEGEGAPQIEAYFAVFGDIYEMYQGGTERMRLTTRFRTISAA